MELRRGKREDSGDNGRGKTGLQIASYVLQFPRASPEREDSDYCDQGLRNCDCREDSVGPHSGVKRQPPGYRELAGPEAEQVD